MMTGRFIRPLSPAAKQRAWMRAQAFVESQAMDGRSGLDDAITAKAAVCRNETAFMDERKKSFVRSKAMDGRGRVDDRPIHTPAQPRNETASVDASKNNGVGL